LTTSAVRVSLSHGRSAEVRNLTTRQCRQISRASASDPRGLGGEREASQAGLELLTAFPVPRACCRRADDPPLRCCMVRVMAS
jgi:hypothetical protein